MRRVLLLAATSLLAACNLTDTVEPSRGLVPARRSTVLPSSAGAIATTLCGFGGSSGGISCRIAAQYPDGSVVEFPLDAALSYEDVVLHPSWSPDGVQIAMDNDTTIYVTDLRNGVTRYLIAGTQGTEPAWSPDGTRIAFSSTRGGDPGLYLVNADGSGTVRVPVTVGYVGQPRWFPNGTRLVFTCAVDAGNSDVCAVNADGTGFARLTTDPASDGDGAVSPDGTRIAFATTRFGGYQTLATMSADGSSQAALNPSLVGREPAWSPDGTQLSYTSPYSRSVCDDYCGDGTTIINADGSPTTAGYAGTQAAWGSVNPLPAPPPDTPPTAAASVTCTNEHCVFDASASTSAYGPLSYRWSFGDGVEATGAVVSHDYPYSWSFAYLLIVTDAKGQTVGKSGEVSITLAAGGYPPTASFTASCTALQCSFDGSPSTDDLGIVSYAWTFGDGTQASGVTATHAYAAGGTFDVTLTVTDGNGKTGSQTQAVTVTPPVVDNPPVAAFTTSCTLLKCSMDASQSADDHGIVSYAWTFGDGSQGAGVTATHAYTAGGTFTVTLVVTDARGQQGTTSGQVTATPPDYPPVAQLSATCSGLNCSFDGSGSSDDHGIVTRAWTFGDGASASNVVAVGHKYPLGGGTYAVTLAVTDAVGQASSKTMFVTAVDQAPTPAFTVSCASNRCTFDGRGSTDDVAVTAYEWNFGTLGSATGGLVTINVKGKTTFTATLTVRDGAGHASTLAQQVTNR